MKKRVNDDLTLDDIHLQFALYELCPLLLRQI